MKIVAINTRPTNLLKKDLNCNFLQWILRNFSRKFFFTEHLQMTPTVVFTSCPAFSFFCQLLYLDLGCLSITYLTVTNLARLGISVHIRSQLGFSIYSGSSPSTRLQVVIQSTHQSTDWYPKLILNADCSKFRPRLQVHDTTPGSGTRSIYLL